MKKLLLATLMLSSCACYAHVVGVSDTGVYIRSPQTGAPLNATDPNEKLPKRVDFMPESHALQSSGFKCNSPMALY